MLGWIQENGPFVVENGEFMPRSNAYSWNIHANVFYIEQPAGVGFSICGDQSECSFNDDNSAVDNLAGVLQWFERFPEFKTNNFFISGESYGGIYIPFLAEQILKHNEQQTDPTKRINLKGIAVGNGVTDWTYDTTPAYLEMSFYFGLVGFTVQDGLTNNNCLPNY